MQPGKGVRSKTRLYHAIYTTLGPLYPLLRRLAPTHVTTTANVGRAMIAVARGGYPKRILENTDINALAARTSGLTMHPHTDLISRFYTAFQHRDADGMAACYHPDIQFSDEVFPDLRGPRAGAMWRMLCERGKDLEIMFRDVNADDSTGRAHWDARYTFSATGRRVHNHIDAHFEFRNGLIVRHRDSFPFWRWAAQALGPVGWLLGWSSRLRNKVRTQAARRLDAFLAGNRDAHA